MSAKLVLALLLALASAGALNWGFYRQHAQASTLPPLALAHPLRSLGTLFGNRGWLVGFLVGILGWVLYVAALAFGPLSLVQAASAGGIGVLALLVWRWGGVVLVRREWVGVAISVGGLVLLGVSLLGRGGNAHHWGGHASWIAIAIWLGASGALAAFFAGPGARLVAAGAGFGIGAGFLYAAGDVGTKAAVAGGWRLLFVPALLAAHGLGFVMLQLGFQRGSALATAGVATLFTNATPIAAGMALFHEPLPPGLRGGLRLLAFAAVVGSAVLLTRAPHEQEPSAAPRPRHRLRLLRLVFWSILVVAATAGASGGRSGSAPRPPLPGWTLVRTGSGGGTVWVGRIPNRHVADTRLSALYVPPGFTARGRYPVVYLLHGLPGSPSSYYASLDIANVADSIIASSHQPFIAVIPVGGPRKHAAAGEWAGVWEDYLTQDVLPWADRSLPTLPNRRGRALAGLCAGGYGAMNTGLRHPRLFGTLEAWEGYFAPVFRDGPFAHATPAVLAANNPTLLVQRRAPLLHALGMRFFVAVGGNHGDVLRVWSLRYAALLTKLHLPHRLWLVPAAEKGHLWRPMVLPALTYAIEGFAAPGARGAR
jgi:enterochelin esterase-like enzyme